MANIERLSRLVEVLEAVKADPAKERDFDMKTWATETQSCGTHACACGWAAMDPVLNAQGLHLVKRPQHAWKRGSDFELTCGPATGLGAAALFFEIEMRAADMLFSPEEYDNECRVDGESDGDVTISAVIDRLKWFVAEQAAKATAL